MNPAADFRNDTYTPVVLMFSQIMTLQSEFVITKSAAG